MKNKYKGLGVFGTFLGMWLSRNFGNNKYFGLDGRMLILLFAILLITACIISMIIKKFYLIAFLSLILISPMFVGFIGIYYDNIILVTGGLIGFLILLGLYVILMKRHQRNKDNINYDKYKNDY